MPEVQVGRKPAGAVQLRMIACLVISVQLVFDKIMQSLEGRVGTSGEALHRPNGAVELRPALGNILPHGKRLEGMRRFPLSLWLNHRLLHQIFGQLSIELWFED